MGSCDFRQIGFGKTVQDAFETEVEKALYDQGHDSYNGTISTTSFIQVLNIHPRYGSKLFETWYEGQIQVIEKYQCYAIEIKGRKAKELKERHG